MASNFLPPWNVSAINGRRPVAVRCLAVAVCLLLPAQPGAAESLDPLGRLLGSWGFRTAASDAHQRFRQQLNRTSPERLVDAASRLLGAGDLKGSAATAQRAAATLSNPLDLSVPLALRLRLWATSTLYIGQSFAGLGNADGARAAFGDLAALTAGMLRLDPRDRSAKQLAVAGEINVASVDLATGRSDAAMTHYARAKNLLEPLVAGNDADLEQQKTLAATDRAIGELKLRAGDTAGAAVSLRASRQRAATLLARDPHDVEARLAQARVSIILADAALSSRDLDGAQAAYGEARQLLSEGDAAAAASLPWRYGLAESKAGLASVAEARGNLAAAADGYRGARDDFLALLPLGGPVDTLRALGSTNFHLANATVQLKDTAGAIDAFRDALDAFTGLLNRNPKDRDAQRRLVATFGRLADVQVASGDPAAALSSFGEAHDILARLAQLDPGNTELLRDRAISDYQIGKLLASRRDVRGAVPYLRDSLKQLEMLRDSVPDDVGLRRSAWTVAGTLGTILEGRRDLQGALAAYRKGAGAIGRTTASRATDPLRTQALTISAERISSVGYMMILAHDFDGALAAEDDALKLAPGTPWIEANRAHALMLLGRTDEARAIYLRHRNEKFPGNIAWADGNRNDFAEMRKVGISSPLMESVEKALAATAPP